MSKREMFEYVIAWEKALMVLATETGKVVGGLSVSVGRRRDTK